MRIPRLSRLTLAIALMCAAVASQAAELRGEVVKIADGDTLTLLTADKQQIRVRLAEIDTPERGQPFGQAAKQLLAELTFREMIRVQVLETDRYGRTIGYIYADGLNVNQLLVAGGAAWCYRKYLRGDWCLPLEDAARRAGRGLWALQPDQVMPPWEWRARKRRD